MTTQQGNARDKKKLDVQTREKGQRRMYDKMKGEGNRAWAVGRSRRWARKGTSENCMML